MLLSLPTHVCDYLSIYSQHCMPCMSFVNKQSKEMDPDLLFDGFLKTAVPLRREVDNSLWHRSSLGLTQHLFVFEHGMLDKKQAEMDFEMIPRNASVPKIALD